MRALDTSFPTQVALATGAGAQLACRWFPRIARPRTSSFRNEGPVKPKGQEQGVSGPTERPKKGPLILAFVVFSVTWPIQNEFGVMSRGQGEL